MRPEVQQLLYADETGELEGVFEVQVMDPVPVDRLPGVRSLIGGEDVVAWSHALLVLLGWGDEVGLVEAERIILGRIENPFDGVDTHRLHGVDLTFDNIAHALALGLDLNGLSHDRVRALAERLLQISGSVFFQNGLESLVTALADPSLTDETEGAISGLVEVGKNREASDLLPALAVLDADRAVRMIERVLSAEGLSRITALGVARTYARMPNASSKRELELIEAREDLPGANSFARRTLEDWGNAQP